MHNDGASSNEQFLAKVADAIGLKYVSIGIVEAMPIEQQGVYKDKDRLDKGLEKYMSNKPCWDQPCSA